MKIYIEDEILEFANKKDEIDNILSKIDESVDNLSKILSHMVVDSLEIYEDYYDYFLDNIRVIEKVEIITLTYKELVDEILVSTLDYVNRTPEKIELLSNSFYKTPNTQAWNNLNDLLGGISWIINTFNSIDQDKRLKDVVSSYEEWNLYAKEIFSIQEILMDFEESIVNKDNITIGDILSYEIVPIFNNINERLLKLLNKEASSYVINR